MAFYYGTKSHDVIDSRTLNLQSGDNIYADDGDDTVYFGYYWGGVEGGRGNDLLIALDSVSPVNYSLSPSGIVADLTIGQVSDGWGTEDRLQGVFSLLGSAYSDSITGSSGNDLFHASRSSDSYDGRNGFDRIGYYDRDSSSISIFYNSQNDTYTLNKTPSESDFLKNIEVLQFRDRDVYLVDHKFRYGTSGQDFRTGTSEDDLFLGDQGNDRIDGSDGIDRIIYNNPNLTSVSIEFLSESDARVIKRYSDSTTETDSLTNIERIQFYKDGELYEGRGIQENSPNAALPRFLGFDWADYGDDYYKLETAQNQILNYLDGMAATTIKLDNILKYDATTNTLERNLLSYSSEEERLAAASFFSKNNIDIVYETYIWGRENSDNLLVTLPNFPEEKIQTFFQNYSTEIAKEAEFAETIGAKVFVFGAEMGRITSLYPELWAGLIQTIRSKFSGLITYGSNFNLSTQADFGTPGTYNGANEAATLSFGHLLDFIGLDCYSARPLTVSSDDGIPTVTEAYHAWDNPTERGYSVLEIMRALSEKYQKPIFIVENAWLSQAPGNHHVSGNPDLPASEAAQANLFSGEFQQFFLHLKDILGGVIVGGQNPDVKYQQVVGLRDGYRNSDGSFGLSREQGGQIGDKIAEDIIRAFFSGTHLNNDLRIYLSPTKLFGFGYDGDDEFVSSSGNNYINGGDGNDIYILNEHRSSAFKTSFESGIFSVIGSASLVGTDTMTDIERIRFSDLTLETSWFSKTDALTAAQSDSLVELYIASFNRAPDAIGLNYWGGRLYDGMSLAEIARSFFVQPETVAAYPSSMSNQTFVTTVYNNVLSRAPDTEGLNYWAREIDTGSISRDVFLLAIINGAKASSGSATDRQTLANKVAVGNHFAFDEGLNNTTWGIDVMDSVTHLASTVTDANALTDRYSAAINTGASALGMPMALMGVDNSDFLLPII